MQPTDWVQWAKWWPKQVDCISKWVISHCFFFFFAFLCKVINDAPSNAPSMTHVIISYVIFASFDVTSSCGMMMSLMTSSHAHVQQVTWSFGIKGATCNGRWFFLHPRPLSSWTTRSTPGSDASGASLWLEPTSFNCFWCINLCFCHTHVLLHMHRSPGVPLTPQLVPLPQDCCTFRLVALVHLVWQELRAEVCGCRHPSTSATHHKYTVLSSY